MTGSGAGCGSHWPLCNGVVLPRAPSLQTIIEFSHRISSGLLLFLALFLLYRAYKAFPGKHIIRKLSRLYLFFLIIEAFIGAFLVLFKHVALNQSIYRGFSVSLHLINTFFLITVAGSLTFLAYKKEHCFSKISSGKLLLLCLGALCFLMIGVSGAITALGDTLFPVTSIKEALARSQNPMEPLFVQLRIYHPLLAVLLSGIIIAICYSIALKDHGLTEKFSYLTIFFIFVQILCGYLNIYLHAPNWLQISHLILAQLTWLSYSFFFSENFIYKKQS